MRPRKGINARPRRATIQRGTARAKQRSELTEQRGCVVNIKAAETKREESN
jgi:hypothetical protein